MPNLNNILGAPVTTGAGSLGAVGLYTGLVGLKAPDSTGDFAVLGLAAFIQILGMILPTLREIWGLKD